MRYRKGDIVRSGNWVSHVDAVATVRLDGRPFQFAIKLERTIKPAARYREMVEQIRQDAKPPLVLYLAADENLLQVLIRELSVLESRVAFSTAGRFKATLLDTPVVTGSQPATFRPFRELLLQLPPAASEDSVNSRSGPELAVPGVARRETSTNSSTKA